MPNPEHAYKTCRDSHRVYTHGHINRQIGQHNRTCHIARPRESLCNKIQTKHITSLQTQMYYFSQHTDRMETTVTMHILHCQQEGKPQKVCYMVKYVVDVRASVLQTGVD